MPRVVGGHYKTVGFCLKRSLCPNTISSIPLLQQQLPGNSVPTPTSIHNLYSTPLPQYLENAEMPPELAIYSQEGCRSEGDSAKECPQKGHTKIEPPYVHQGGVPVRLVLQKGTANVPPSNPTVFQRVLRPQPPHCSQLYRPSLRQAEAHSPR